MVKLTAMTIDLTEGCNLACDYCFTYSDHKRRVLSEDMGKRILKWFVDQTDPTQYIHISWWGGEPLLEWELLKKLTTYGHKLLNDAGITENYEFGGTTNGVLYTKDRVEWLFENKSLMLVSLDGIKESHDAHRKFKNGGSSWEIVDKNIREAKKIYPGQKVRMSISPLNIQYFFESIQYFFEDLGLTDIAYSPVYEENWDEKAVETLEEQFELMANYIVKQHKNGNIIKAKHMFDCIPDLEKTPQNPCGAGNQYACWSVDGFLYPCHRFNKHGQTTEERYNSPLIIARPKGNSFEWVNKDWRNEFITFKDNPPEDCKECKLLNLNCHGNCWATNFDIAGSIRSHTDFICKYSHIQYKAIEKMYKKAKDEGVILNKKYKKNNINSCICYNMCYAENTKDEIIHFDRKTDFSCGCYNARFEYDNKKSRNIKYWLKERDAEKNIVHKARNMIKHINKDRG